MDTLHKELVDFNRDNPAQDFKICFNEKKQMPADGYYLTIRCGLSGIYTHLDEVKSGHWQVGITDASRVIAYRKLTDEEDKELKKLMEAEDSWIGREKDSFDDPITEALASMPKFDPEEEDEIQPWTGVIYYSLSYTSEIGTAVLEVSDNDQYLPDDFDTYTSLIKRFEIDFPQYSFYELMEAVYEVWEGGSKSITSIDKFKSELEKNPNYKKLPW